RSPRRTADRVGADVRADARRDRLRRALRELGGQRRRGGRARGERSGPPRALPSLEGGRPDDRIDHQLDARLRGRESDSRQPRPLAEFIAGNDQFFLNIAMAAGKALADPAAGVPHSTLVTVMARNGTDFGIRVSALGDRWFTAPVNTPVGLYFPGFSGDDANP